MRQSGRKGKRWSAAESAKIVADEVSDLARHRRVSEVMTREPVCVLEETSLESATSILLERGLSAAPVVDDAGRVVGMLSMTDIVREAHDRGETEEIPLRTRQRKIEYEIRGDFFATELARSTVADVMRPVVAVLPENAPLSQAAALMAAEGVQRLPVVDRERRIRGIVSALDLLRWWASQDGYSVPSYALVRKARPQRIAS
ncbi:MAG: CBS domain-containing protein [Deltaproteobacteria bacterium]|nr:CBS domain-containing protein [Deltaproteobacteria bacterium]